MCVCMYVCMYVYVYVYVYVYAYVYVYGTPPPVVCPIFFVFKRPLPSNLLVRFLASTLEIRCEFETILSNPDIKL